MKSSKAGSARRQLNERGQFHTHTAGRLVMGKIGWVPRFVGTLGYGESTLFTH